MFSFYKYLIPCILMLGLVSINYAQTIYHQDVFKGGITGAGYSFGLGAGTGTFPVYIEPGSTIRKAYLFSYQLGDLSQPCALTCMFNGINLQFSDTNRVSPILNNGGLPGLQNFAIHAIDVTNLVMPATTNYTIDMPVTVSCIYYNSVFLVILYDNPLLGINNVVLLMNDKDNAPINLYNSQNLNPINTMENVGISVYSDRILDTATFPGYGSYITLNPWQPWLLGGGDNVNSLQPSGVKGHFYYQDSVLYGLDDDTPDTVMGGSDGLAEISNFLSNNATSLNFSTEYQNSTGPNMWTDFFLTFQLAYTTPCDTFTAGISNSDTLICYADTLQLSAYGGVKYKWKPSFGLNCDTCASPLASPDSSTLYTCTIYNTDSCSKVLPIKVNVRPRITFAASSIPVTCGLQDGSITINNVQNTQNPITYFLNGISQSSNIFTNLDTGTYNIGLIDSNGCSSSVLAISLNDTNYVTANFSVSPLTGVSPLDIVLTYTGNNGNNFIWTFGNGDSSLIMNPSYTYNNPGSFLVTLITWANDSSCSDTATQIIVVDPNLVITQLITPNNDGKNDTWIISGLSLYPNAGVEIFNRWGNMVYSSEPYQNDWAGQCTVPICIGNGILPSGTYFYHVYPYGKNNTLVPDIKSGYLELQP